jgi:hypothetical protein
MIHLFRKIRQQLLKNNRFKKYAFYALGEIVLVMVGILLALQFNAWSKEAENTKKEEWYLINIVEDIEYQKSILKDMKIFCNETIDTGERIIEEYNRRKSFSDVDSLDQRLNFLMSSFTFPNTNNTYSELVSSGKFDLIQEKKLSLSIIEYFSFIREHNANSNTDIINVFYPEIYPVYNQFSQVVLPNNNDKESGIDNDITTHIHDALKKPASKLLLLNAIKTQILLLLDNIEVIDETLLFSKEVIQSIDDYLGLTSEMVNHFD